MEWFVGTMIVEWFQEYGDAGTVGWFQKCHDHDGIEDIHKKTKRKKRKKNNNKNNPKQTDYEANIKQSNISI